MSEAPAAAPRALRLDVADNVAVAFAELAVGERVALDGEEVVVREPVRFGHKLAIRPIAAGSPGSSTTK